MDLSTILTPEITASIVNIVVTVLVTIVGALVTALSPKIMGYVKAKTTEQQYETLEYVITQAVRYAEQAFKDFEGEQKFDAAYQFVSTVLEARGIKVTGDELEKLIEAAVLKEFNPPRPPEVTSPKPQEPTVPVVESPEPQPEPGWENKTPTPNNEDTP